MSTAVMIKVSAGCPTFDGTDYPYWKNNMRMHLEAIENDLWYVVENDFANTADDGDDDYAPTYCFMAKGAKVLKYRT